jgi:hypothetical protein
MTTDHRVQGIDILRAIFCAPFHTDDIGDCHKLFHQRLMPNEAKNGIILSLIYQYAEDYYVLIRLNFM